MNKPYLLSHYDYALPQNAVAQKPVRPRDASRLMVVDRSTGEIAHRRFADIVEYLRAGDVLVLNDSKVIPARLIGIKSTGGTVEILLVRKVRDGIWTCLLKNFRHGEIGKAITIGKTSILRCVPKKSIGGGLWEVHFAEIGWAFEHGLQKHGAAPTPPYIAARSALSRYQTVYAKNAGSVAAPTAGFHFTKPLLAKLRKKGIRVCTVTLHVGPGTFLPIRFDDIRKHTMHPESATLSAPVARTINDAKREGRRVIAIGTTSVRVLESFSDATGHFRAGKKDVGIFIYPPYHFKTVDVLITNFHLPKSTLLLLVSAFAGTELIKACYAEAIRQKYRFYSFGDAMLIQ